MSNFALRSQLSSLQNQLREAERINAELQNEIAILANGTAQAENDFREYSEKVLGVLQSDNEMLNSSHHTVVEAIAVQREIDKLYEKNKRIELANKKIRACNNKKYYDFANYRTVRKIVQGIMDNLDLNMISDAVILKSIEVRHLQTPDYWLTCVLISIMAWRNDDKALADRAMAKAISLDKKNCAVFYMLFNLRMNRNDAALKWFDVYRQCELTGSDRRTFLLLFSMVSRSLNDNVDERSRAEFSEFIKETVNKCAAERGYSEEAVIKAIKDGLSGLKTPFTADYPLIRKYCDGYRELFGALSGAVNNENILGFILKTVNVTSEDKNRFIKEFIDEMIALPNDEEKATYNEIELNELIIKLGGDTARANELYEKERARRENEINLIAEMIDWIFDKENRDISAQMRCNMFILTKYHQAKGAELYRSEYQKGFSLKQPITVGDYHSEADFGDERGEHEAVSRFYGDLCEKELAEVKSKRAFIWFGAGAAAAVLSFFTGFLLLSLTAIGAIGGAVVLIKGKLAKKRISLAYSEKIRSCDSVVSELYEEFARFSAQYSQADEYYSRIAEELSKI